MRGSEENIPAGLAECFVAQVYDLRTSALNLKNVWVFPVFPKIGVPQNEWFIMENPIKLDDLGVPLFLETPIFLLFVLCWEPPSVFTVAMMELSLSHRLQS